MTVIDVFPSLSVDIRQFVRANAHHLTVSDMQFVIILDVCALDDAEDAGKIADGPVPWTWVLMQGVEK